MSIDGLPRHAIDQITQAVGQRVEVRLIDLVHVSCQYDFVSLASSDDDRFAFVRRQVLGFIAASSGRGDKKGAFISKRRSDAAYRAISPCDEVERF